MTTEYGKWLMTISDFRLRWRGLADLSFDHLQRREDHWAIVDLIGKGGHIRTVPVPGWVKRFLDDWFEAARITQGEFVQMRVHIRNYMG